jgi:hypothetical protein
MKGCAKLWRTRSGDIVWRPWEEVSGWSSARSRGILRRHEALHATTAHAKNSASASPAAGCNGRAARCRNYASTGAILAFLERLDGATAARAGNYACRPLLGGGAAWEKRTATLWISALPRPPLRDKRRAARSETATPDAHRRIHAVAVVHPDAYASSHSRDRKPASP